MSESEVQYVNLGLKLATDTNVLTDTIGELEEKIQDNEKNISTLCRYVVKENKKVKKEFDDKHTMLSNKTKFAFEKTIEDIKKLDSKSHFNFVLIICTLVIIFILCINTKILDIRLKDLSNLSVKSIEYTTLNPVCPMCHSDSVKLKQLTEDYYIECENCGLHTGYYGNEATLRSNWNNMVDSILMREIE